MLPRPVPDEVAHTYLESRYRGDRHDAAQTLVLKTYDDTHQLWGTTHPDMQLAEVRREMQLLGCLFMPVKGQIQELAKPNKKGKKPSIKKIVEQMTGKFKLEFGDWKMKQKITEWACEEPSSYEAVEDNHTDPYPTDPFTDLIAEATAEDSKDILEDFAVDISLAHSELENRSMFDDFAAGQPYYPAARYSQLQPNDTESLSIDQVLMEVQNNAVLVQEIDGLRKQTDALEDKNADLEDKNADLEADNVELNKKLQAVRHQLHKARRALEKTKV